MSSRMTGRVVRLEQTYHLDRPPEGEPAATVRRLEEVVHLVPDDALRLLLEIARAGHSEGPRSPAHLQAEERLAGLLETGMWLA